MPSPEHEAVVATLQQHPLDVELSLPDVRASFDAMFATPPPDDLKIETIWIAGREADILTTDGSDPNRAVLHFHGGCYVFGSNRMYRDFGTRMSRATGAAVLVPNYRLAPEDPFPAALEDAVASYEWLLERGFAPLQIALSGDSAGGGLVAATLATLRDKGVPLPSAAIFISPWTDLQLTGASYATRAADDPVTNPKSLAIFAQHYAGDDLRNPLVSPLHGSVQGFPPSQIFVGTRECMLEDARQLRTALKSAGVLVDYVEAEGLIHVWSVLAATAPESADCLKRVGRFLDSHVSRC
jgi:monoterpene epsilon-lactone hydrolase